MATFDASQATRTEYAQNVLGKYGVGWPVGKVVYIDTNGDVYETETIMGTFEDHVSPGGYAIDAGSGDNGYAIFRRGKTYTITSGEATTLGNAGYTTT